MCCFVITTTQPFYSQFDPSLTPQNAANKGYEYINDVIYDFLDSANSRISTQRQEWLKDNPFHTATRIDRCDYEDVNIVIEKKYPKHEDEYLDLVDANDNVIGRELRSVIYKEGVSNFRVVNGFIRNYQGDLWIPIRKSDKRIFPNAFDFSVGEHVESDEPYDDAFKRGMTEELNLDPSTPST